MKSLGKSGMPAASSGLIVDDGREKRRKGERRRFGGWTSPESSAALESEVLWELMGRELVGISGIDSPSDTTIDEGREKRRNGDTFLLVGVSSAGWEGERDGFRSCSEVVEGVVVGVA
jgi:hypothetical protein